MQGNHFWRCWFGRLLARVGIFSYSLYAVHIPYLLIIKVSILPLGKKFTTLIGSSVLVMLNSFKKTLKPLFFNMIDIIY